MQHDTVAEPVFMVYSQYTVGVFPILYTDIYKYVLSFITIHFLILGVTDTLYTPIMRTIIRIQL